MDGGGELGNRLQKHPSAGTIGKSQKLGGKLKKKNPLMSKGEVIRQ